MFIKFEFSRFFSHIQSQQDPFLPLEGEAGLGRESFEMERVKARDQAEKSLLSLAPSITNIY